jgi:hypothetical protein
MSFKDVWTIFFCAMGFGLGVYWFVKGFPTYRRYRYLADTPELPIRGIPMGLVHIHGKAWGKRVISSPVSRMPCLYYKVVIERCEPIPDGGRTPWQHYMTDCNGVEFYIEDQTGKARIDAHGAELDLPLTVRCRTGDVAVMGGLLDLLRNWRNMSARDTLPAPEEDLRAYVGSLGPPCGGAYRLTESCLLLGHWYDVIGTCVENPNAQGEDDRNMLVKGENEPTFLISFRSEQSLQSTLRNRAAKYIFGGAGLSIVCLAVILAKLRWL